jgi:type II secretory pathway pseudopilin PulG
MSLLELLVVIAILGTLAALVMPNISPMRGSASTQIARQQQVQLQTALGSWVAAESAKSGGLAAARSAYNSAGSKLGLVQGYLQSATYASLTGSGNTVTSQALTEAGASLEFTSWSLTNAPAVLWK